MSTPKKHIQAFSRREALTLLGTAAGAGVFASGPGELVLHAQQRFTSVEEPSFPSGAIVRTLQGDIPPTELTSAATLFHEHVGGGSGQPLLLGLCNHTQPLSRERHRHERETQFSPLTLGGQKLECQRSELSETLVF